MAPPSDVNRYVLPIHDRPHVGLTTYDAKDPDTAFPPIAERPTRPPARRTCCIILLDDIGFGAVVEPSAAPSTTPTADRLAAGGLKLSRFHTTALCAPTSAGAAHRPQPPHRAGMGAITEIATSAPGYSSIRPKVDRPAGRDPQAQRLLDGPVRQVPRGAGLEDQPDGTVRPVADRQRLRLLLRLHRRRDEPVLPGPLRGHDADRAAQDPGRGLPPDRGPDRPGDRLDPPAALAHDRPALLRLLRPRRHPRAAPRAARVVRQVQGPLRRRLGRAARARSSPARRRSA